MPEDDVHDPDFQFALKELLAACQPTLGEDLERARSVEDLMVPERRCEPSCCLREPPPSP